MRARVVVASSLLVVSSLCAADTAAQAAAAAETRGEPWGGPMSQLLWIDAQGGVEAVELETFSANADTLGVGFIPTAGVGPTARVGAGLRLGFLTLGARGRVAAFQDQSSTRTVGPWQIWTLDGELGLHIPLGRVEPHVAFGLGYTSFGGFGDAISGLGAGLDVHGIDARLDGGVDFWVTHTLSLGFGVNGELLVLARPGVSLRDLATPKAVATLNEAKARVLEADGSSVGSAIGLTGNLGVHF